MEERNQLILDLTDEIADQVLHNNDVHGRQISIDQVRSLNNPFPFARAIQWVSNLGGNSPARLGLPDTDGIAKRAAAGAGLTRPELAVLGAHVKLEAAKLLEGEDPAKIPGMAEMLQTYFPKTIQESYGESIRNHMLSTEIGFTVALNGMVVDAGAGAIPGLMELTSRSVLEILTAWYHVWDALEVGALRDSIFGANAPLSTRYEAWTVVVDGLLGMLAVLLGPGEESMTNGELNGVVPVLKGLGRRRGVADKARFAEYSERLQSKGLSKSVSDRVAAVADLTTVLEIAKVQSSNDESPRDATVRYLAIGNASGLLPAVYRIESQRVSGQWEQLAMEILRGRYLGLLRYLVDNTPIERDLKLGVDRASFRLGRGPLESVKSVVDGIAGEGASVGALLVAEQRVRAAVLK